MTRPKLTPAERERAYLRDIAIEARDVFEFTKGLSFSDFASSKLVQKAVVKSLESIGEAVKNLTPETKDKHPAVPWRKIARLRDLLSHHYGEVDYAQIWEIIEGGHLQELLHAVEA